MNLAELFAPPRFEKRATMRDTDGWFVDWLTGGMPTASGERVNENTALAHSAYFACIRNISQDLAKLPIKPYAPMDPRGSKVLRDHQTYKLVHDQPNPEMTAVTFWETIYAHALGWHGGFAEIVETANGQPTALWPIDPTRVSIHRNQGTKEVFYQVLMDNGAAVRLPPRRVLHIHGLGMDGITSMVIARVLRESIGGALAAQRHSSAYFANGAVASGVIEVPGPMKKEALNNLRDSFADRYAGTKNHYKPVILEQGAKWNATSNDPERSQLIETREFTGKEVCRAFRMPPHKAGFTDAQPRANVEQENISYVGDTLLPWMVKGEQACWWKLLRPSEQARGIFYRYTTRALLRGDMAQQAGFFSQMIQNGVYSPDDVRDLMDENPIRDGLGDTYLVNGSMIPLDVAAHKTLVEVSPVAPPAPEPDDDEPDAQEENARAVKGIAEAHRALLASAIDRLCTIEGDKIQTAKRKDRLDERFWDTTRQCARDALEPPIRALIGSMDATKGVALNGGEEAIVLRAVYNHIEHTKAGKDGERGAVEANTIIEDMFNEYKSRNAKD